MLAYRSAHAKQFFGCMKMRQRRLLQNWYFDEFWAKTTSHGHRSEAVDDVQKRSRFAQKSHNWWRIMCVQQWHWNQRLIIPMEASRSAKTGKTLQVRLNGFVLLTVFFDCNGVVLYEFLPQGRTVNKEYYHEVMRRWCEAIREKRTELWKNQSWNLHHNNAWAHTSMLVREFLAKNKTVIMPQPPYSPDLAPAYFYLFPKLKAPMKGKCFTMTEEISEKSKQELLVIPKSMSQKRFEDWKKTLA